MAACMRKHTGFYRAFGVGGLVFYCGKHRNAGRPAFYVSMLAKHKHLRRKLAKLRKHKDAVFLSRMRQGI